MLRKSHPEIFPSEGLVKQILEELRNDPQVRDKVVPALMDNNMGMLSRFADFITTVDGNAPEVFAAAFMEAVDKNRLREWFTCKVYTLTTIMLDDNYHVTPQLLQIFAGHCSLAPEEMRKRMYGDPENPERVLMIAELISGACAGAISSLISEYLARGMDKNAPAIFRRLANDNLPYFSIISGFKAMEENAMVQLSLNKLKERSLQQITSDLNSTSIPQVIQLELNATKKILKTELATLDKLQQQHEEASGPESHRLFTRDLTDRIRQCRQNIHRLENRESMLLNGLKALLPQRGLLLEALEAKKRFYEHLLSLPGTDTRLVSTEIQSLNEKLRFRVETRVADNDFANDYRDVNKFLDGRIARLTEHADVYHTCVSAFNELPPTEESLAQFQKSLTHLRDLAQPHPPSLHKGKL